MQLTREDWVRAGMRVLASSGINNVKVEILAKELHISKGSFYNYWPNRAEFLDVLLSIWETQGTRSVIDEIEHISSPYERFQRLFEVSFAADKSLEAAVHQWANNDSAVARRVAAIEDARMAYMTKLLREMGKTATQANDIARLCYFVYLGWIDWSQRNENVLSGIAELQNMFADLGVPS